MSWRAGAALLVGLALTLSACGSSGSSDDDDEGGTDESGSGQNRFGDALLSWTPLAESGGADLLVGAPGGGGSRDEGVVFIYALDSGGGGVETGEIGRRRGGFEGDLDEEDGFGSAFAHLGDLDGDGLLELAVGSPLDDSGPDSNRGGVWILSVGQDLLVQDETKIATETGGFSGVPRRRGRFGISLAAVGDLDGDGVTELAVGSPLDDDGGSERGAFWTLFLTPEGRVRADQKVSSTLGNFTGELDSKDEFGAALAAIGDLDGDGLSELAVGAPGDDDGASRAGAVWILFLEAGAQVRSHRKISTLAGGFDGAVVKGNEFGRALAFLGDLDGDGIGDLAVGAPGDDEPLDRGAVWLLFLAGDGTVQSELKIAPGVGGFVGDLDVGDFFGSAVAPLPDLDQSGGRDLVVGASGTGDGENGGIWVLLLDAAGRVTSETRIRP